MSHPSNEETICAISTPLGNGGIGVIRISGKKAFEIGDRIFRSRQSQTFQNSTSHQLYYGEIFNPQTGETVDEAMGAVMRGPKSYTAENVLELSCHGNLRSLRKILTLLIHEGAREALPGEFTKRAFLNGRIDLVQAEAVMDLISAESEAGRRQALKHLKGDFSKIISELREGGISLLSKIEANIDFSEEDIEILSEEEAKERIYFLIGRVEELLKTAQDGRIVREGYLIVLAGRPNVGKSSLLNLFLEKQRAIVTPIAGTTRDTLEEALLLRGVKIRLVDTAGIRKTDDLVEIEGIRRTEEILNKADLILWMLDATQGWTDEDDKEIEKFREKNYLILFNKMDLVSDKSLFIKGNFPEKKVLKISSLAKKGVEELEERIFQEARILEGSASEQGAVVVRGRHEDGLKEARKSLFQALDSLNRKMSYEFVALDLKGAVDALGEILGISTSDEMLERIFKDFCIGK